MSRSPSPSSLTPPPGGPLPPPPRLSPTSAARIAPPPKLPLPPLPGSRLSFNPHVVTMSTTPRDSSLELDRRHVREEEEAENDDDDDDDDPEEEEEEEEEGSSYRSNRDDSDHSHASSTSTSPSSITPTLAAAGAAGVVVVGADEQGTKVATITTTDEPRRPLTAPATSATACPFPTTTTTTNHKRTNPKQRKPAPIFFPGPPRKPRRADDDDKEGETFSGSGSEEEDCGCGPAPTGFLDSEDELDVLDFVLKDQQLALRKRRTTASTTDSSSHPVNDSSPIAGETGLGLFKRPGIEGLSLSPSPSNQSMKPTIAVRRPSTAPAGTTTVGTGKDEDAAAGLRIPAPQPRARTRTRTISDFIPKLRLPRSGSSSSEDDDDDEGRGGSTTEEDARDSDETIARTGGSRRGRGAARKRKTKRKSSSSTKPKKAFDRFIMPSAEELVEARQCELVGETGIVVTLDELIKQRGRVVFVALRHFWCNLCQQYVEALREAMLSLVTFQHSVENLSTQSSVSVGEYHEPRAVIPPLYIVLVSTGSHRLIPTYRQRLDCPFPLYVDKSRKLYKTLGMTKSSLGMGKETEKGSYIKNSNWENVVNSTKNGIAMPRYPGPQAQLGGEFVFTHHPEDDSVTCEYASRMHTTRAHAEIPELFAAAGVQLNDEDAESVYGESMYSSSRASQH